MRGFLRFLLVSLCAEWLITFRIWMAPQVLLSFLLMAALRFALLAFLPFWQNGYLAFSLPVAALVWRLRAFIRGARSRRTAYETPNEGVPWLVIVTRSPRAAFGLESVIVLIFALWLASGTGELVYPSGMDTLHPPWRDWLSQNGELFATMHPFCTWLALVFWNLSQGDAARQPQRQKAAETPRVREQPHSPLQLPTVKELAEEFNQDTAP